ncbi:MAG: SDR family NAD(P)-dependent oxidoreductase [Verrucomicrobia bacterium]|nr:SDR family NAD(P)-dependent oxidoreductase [Verrucomicrobiota bacterium]MDA1086875.1 SDR family NAD(P)-dependent oxidoreductase [Verrucomicrobiota bacterium]
MRAFVTGAAGFVGSRLCERLAARGRPADITCLIRNAASAAQFRARGFDVIEADMMETAAYSERMLQCEHVYHVGALARFGNGLDYEHDNTEATRRILSVLAQSPCLESLVFTSTIGAVDRTPQDACDSPLTTASTPCPQSDYGRSKLACETMIEASDLPWIILRPAWVYGPGMRADSHIAAFVRAIARGKAFTRFEFPGRVSVIHVNDLADALVHLAHHGVKKQILFAADGTHPTLGSIFQRIASVIAPERRQIPIPAWASGILGSVRRFLPFRVQCLFRDVLTCTGQHLVDAGCPPHTPFEQGLGETIADFQSWTKGRYLVTGAAGGIGAAIARQLAAQGTPLYLVDHDQTALLEMKEATGGEILAIDLTDSGAPSRILEWTQAHGDPVVGLVNNAGIGHRADHHTLAPDQIERVVQLNAVVPMVLCRLFLPAMLEHGSGHIVNISSSTAGMPLPGMAVYGASKTALHGFSQSLWAEVESRGVDVTCVCPSGTRTGFQERAGVKVLHDGRGLASPDAVAAAVLDAVQRHRVCVVLGVRSVILRAVTFALPVRWRARLWRVLMAKMR